MLKIVLVCNFCRRRHEMSASVSNERKHNKIAITGTLPRSWKENTADEDKYHFAHGDPKPQHRQFCSTECQNDWYRAERGALEAFRKAIRDACLEAQGAVVALANVADSVAEPFPTATPF